VGVDEFLIRNVYQPNESVYCIQQYFQYSIYFGWNQSMQHYSCLIFLDVDIRLEDMFLLVNVWYKSVNLNQKTDLKIARMWIRCAIPSSRHRKNLFTFTQFQTLNIHCKF